MESMTDVAIGSLLSRHPHAGGAGPTVFGERAHLVHCNEHFSRRAISGHESLPSFHCRGHFGRSSTPAPISIELQQDSPVWFYMPTSEALLLWIFGGSDGLN